MLKLIVVRGLRNPHINEVNPLEQMMPSFSTASVKFVEKKQGLCWLREAIERPRTHLWHLLGSARFLFSAAFFLKN